MTENIEANSMSVADFKFESNSKGTNVTSHVYSNATEDQVKNAYDLAVKWHKKGLKERFD